MKLKQISEKDGCILLSGLQDFDLIHTFTCGQCFRWQQRADNRWLGITGEHTVILSQTDDVLVFEHTTAQAVESIWIPYLDLARNYAVIKERLAQDDPIMQRAISYGPGLRLLNQDPWEMLITWLISQNNGIPRITSIIDTLCRCFGEPLTCGSDVVYQFPTPERLAGLDSCDLDICRAGYRKEYIQNAAALVAEGNVDPYAWRHMQKEEVRAELLGIKGVGEKVADCTLLFTGLFKEVFPVDRWVKRVMATWYMGTEASTEALHRYAEERFGDLAGYAQEYLFYLARDVL